MSIFDFLRKKKNSIKGNTKNEEIHTGGKLVKEDFNVVGTHYHEDSLKKLASLTEDWRKSVKTLIGEGKVGTKIFKYTYINKPVKIVPDPGNVHDKNAMKVLIAGEHVGFIPRDEAPYVKKILETTSVKYITASVRGGTYKVISTNGDKIETPDSVRIKVRIAYA